MNNKHNSSKYAWNDALILDKIQEILDGKSIDDLDFTQEEIENLKTQLSHSISDDELNESASLLAESIYELQLLPDEDIKSYISRLIDYLDKSNLKCIIGEFNGIEFEVHEDSNVDDVFNEYYAKYDKTYGISDMLSDLGLK